MLTDRVKLLSVLVDQIVRRDCYQVRRLIDNPPAVVLDLGANCGVFSLLCRCLFPYAVICSIEPDPESFDRLRQNLEGLDCQLANVGLGSDGSRLSMREARDSGSRSTERSDDGRIVGLTLAQICRQFGVDPSAKPTLLKVDTEGAERQLIEDPADEALLLSCQQFSAEFHFAENGGSAKWANPMNREVGERWIGQLLRREGWRGGYRPDRLGGLLVAHRA